MVAVHRREQQHGDGEEKPEPRQPVTLGQKTGQIEAARRRLGGIGAFSFGGS